MPDTLSKKEIRNIMRVEQKSRGIAKINPGLYRALLKYLQNMEESYLKAHQENKTKKALALTKDIKDTERDISTIYELRERKVLIIAQDIVRGGSPSLKYLIPEEKLLLLRLSSMLLETRKKTGIDFHHEVDDFIRTIAREYELEREIFAPFKPLPDFCEDDEPSANSIGSMDPATSTTIEEDDEVIAEKTLVHGNGEKNKGDETLRSLPDPSSQAGISTTNINTNANIRKENLQISPGKIQPTQLSVQSSGIDRTSNEIPDQKETNEVENEETDSVEDEENETREFLKDYAIVGTMGSMPQFRGNDMKDYKFEAGEIISIPRKMAKILETQGKIFIIDIEK